MTTLGSFSGSATEGGTSTQSDSSGGTGTGPGVASTESSPSTQGSEPTGDQPNFDLGVQPDVDLDVEEGCTKVDFLFVIDNSGSMGDDQQNLVNNFPNFIGGIQDTLENVDEYHVGVVTSDVYAGNIPACRVLGGLVSKTEGNESSNQLCGPYAEGGNYMTQLDDLASSFACAAQVGSDGDGAERPMNAMEAAVRGDHAGADECNEGFLRDDALLVVVIISDEWDGPNDPEGSGSTGDPNSWYDTVVAAKGNIPENIVVLTLSHINGGLCPPGEDFFDPGGIQTFTELFGDNGFMGCITGDFAAIFSEATGVIDAACDNFMPPG